MFRRICALMTALLCCGALTSPPGVIPSSPGVGVSISESAPFIPPPPDPLPNYAIIPAGPDITNYGEVIPSLGPAARLAVGEGVLYQLGGTPRSMYEDNASLALLIGTLAHPFAVNFPIINISSRGTMPNTTACNAAPLTGVPSLACFADMAAGASSWVAKYAHTNDIFVFGNEYNVCFETGNACAGQVAQFRAGMDLVETAVKLACPGCKIASAINYKDDQEALITSLIDLSHDFVGLTVYAPPTGPPNGHQCNDPSLTIAEYVKAKAFIEGISPTLDWAIMETGICTHPDLGGSPTIQASWAFQAMNWVDSLTDAEDENFQFLTTFIALDGFLKSTGCQRFGDAASKYVCRLGICSTDGRPKIAATVLNLEEICPNQNTYLAGFYVYGPAGATTDGGAGEQLVTVDRLGVANVATSRADGTGGTTGSLRYLMENAASPCPNTGCRVRFTVPGVIPVADHIAIPGNVTIDGSTAPKQGISVVGVGGLEVQGDDVIIRHISVPSAYAPGVAVQDSDCIHIQDSNDVVIDHVTMRSCTDEVLDIVGNPSPTRRVTVQNSIISHTGKGTLVSTDTSDIAFYRNFFATSASRNPQVVNTVNSKVYLAQNIVYNFIYGHLFGSNNAATLLELSILNSAFKKGPILATKAIEKYGIGVFGSTGGSPGRVHGSGGNHYNIDGVGSPFSVWNDHGEFAPYTLNYGASNYPNTWSTTPCMLASCEQRKASGTGIDVDYPVNVLNQTDLQNVVLDDVGHTLPCRDQIDVKLMDDYYAGTDRSYYSALRQPYVDPTTDCGTLIAAPSVDAGGPYNSVAGATVALNSTPTSAVNDPLVVWEVTAGDSAGQPCEPGASTLTTNNGMANTAPLVVNLDNEAAFPASGNVILGPTPYGKYEIATFTNAAGVFTLTVRGVGATDPITFISADGQVRVREDKGALWFDQEGDTSITPRAIDGTCTLSARIYDNVNSGTYTDTATITTSD